MPPDAFKVNSVRLKIKFETQAKDSHLVVRFPIVATDLEKSVDDVSADMDRYNLKLPIFTTHSYPPISLIGHEHLISDPQRALWRASFLGDNPGSPLYRLNGLEKEGVEYFLTADKTSSAGKVWPIEQLTYPFLFNDGVYRSSFHRIYNTVPGVTDASASWEVSLGSQFKSALAIADADAAGTGSVLYNHWGIPLPKDKFDKVGGIWPFSQPSVDALRELSARFYGVRDGKPVDPKERLWVAPLFRVLTYSTLLRFPR